ncbi:MAG: four helix bundle protein [Candidatus Margulisiibacteriota bacterium]
MVIKKFEDLDTWKEARKLTNLVYKLTKKIHFSKDFSLRDQIQRATISTMANTAEGFDSGSNPHFIQFLTYSRRSASEVQSHLYVALDNKYITDIEFHETYAKAKSIQRLCMGLIKYLKKTRNSSRT